MKKKSVEAETANNSNDKPVCKIIPLYPNGIIAKERRELPQAIEDTQKLRTKTDWVVLEASVITMHAALATAKLTLRERKLVDYFHQRAVEAIERLK
ncbi:MAG: hypothetical protein LBH58_01475 [Tannerellaceae bacterium]|jgi:hypothetical protein|nr:hypothetical protein [Tannerellaceae bacterium]